MIAELHTINADLIQKHIRGPNSSLETLNLNSKPMLKFLHSMTKDFSDDEG